MTPEELLDSVNSRETFLVFLAALLADQTDADGWKNASLENFLEAMYAWAIDTQLLVEQANWRDFAQLLLAGKSYE